MDIDTEHTYVFKNSLEHWYVIECLTEGCARLHSHH